MSAVNPATSLVVSPQRRLGVTLCLVAALAACQKSDKLPTTAERLKNVEVRQQVEPESYLPRKSVDYMATMKDLKDAPDKPDAAKAEPKAAKIAMAPAAPAPAPAVTAPKLPEMVKAAPPEARPAAVTPAAVPAQAAGVAEAARKSGPWNKQFAQPTRSCCLTRSRLLRGVARWSISSMPSNNEPSR